MTYLFRSFAGSTIGFLLAVFTVVVAGPAQASCAEPPALDDALARGNAVFVGTVTALRFDDRVAEFLVEDVWKGEVGATAIVNGGPDLEELQQSAVRGLSVMTSIDRTYRLGERYLVVARARDGAVLLDDACSATQVYAPALGSFRPATAHPPETPAASPDAVTQAAPSDVLRWIAGGAAAAGFGSILLYLFLKRRRSDRSALGTP